MNDAVERREHAANIQRLRVGTAVGAAAWVAFAASDIALAYLTYHVDVRLLLWARFGALPIALAMMLVLWRTEPTRRSLRAIDFGLFGLASVCLAWIAAHAGGIASPYTPGVAVVMLARAMCVIEPWQKGLRANAWIAGLHLSALLVCVLNVPRAIVQLHDPGLVALFAVQASLLIAAGASIVVGGHMAWHLRRRLYEQHRVAHYKLLSPLGSGAQGEVWRAFDERRGGQVALKLLRHHDTDARRLARFASEVEALSRMGDPHLIKVLDYGVTEEGLWYYAMELLEGQDLGALVRDRGALEAHHAAYIFEQVARGLASAHRVGTLHRDIKPENVFVCSGEPPGSRVRLLDFGVAKLRGDALTRTNGIVGTPAFMAPESALGTEVDARADIYSLGATLFFALAGKAPFAEATTEGTLLAHVQKVPPCIRRAAVHPVPEQLAWLVDRCLAKSPAARLSSALEVAELLAEMGSAGEGASVVDTRVTRTLS